MNWNTVEGKWTEMKGIVREKWAKLTDDDIESIAGKRDRLVGKLQQAYGKQRDAVEQDVDSWLTQVGEPRTPQRH